MWTKLLGIFISTFVMMFVMGYGISFYLAATNSNEEAQEEIEDYFLGEKSLGPSIGHDEFFEATKKDKFLTEEVLLQTLHSMVHQKVKADQKWGIDILITQERVDILIEAVENTKMLSHKETYLDILNRWYVGDFSQADKDHDAIWKIQDGNIGKATGLLSPVEELEYIERNK